MVHEALTATERLVRTYAIVRFHARVIQQGMW